LLIIPAIDIKSGLCVRLKQGRMEDETIFSHEPDAMACKWLKKGAERLHLVDLDGAIQGRPVNSETIRRIVDAVPIPVQLGGGIRNMATLKAYFDLGIQYVILGTVLYKDPEFVMRAVKMYPGKIILGIDAMQEGRVVAVEGWTEDIKITPLELSRRYEESGVAAVIYTDISRDGMQTGPNLEGTRNLARALNLPVIASGGISGIKDVLDILDYEEDGIMGMITGRALYDGSLDLAEAIKKIKLKKIT